jgi:hypothetical protein
MFCAEKVAMSDCASRPPSTRSDCDYLLMVVVVEVAAGTVVAARVVWTVVLVVAGVVGVSTTVVQDVSSIVGITTIKPISGATAAARQTESTFFMLPLR